MRIYHPTNPNLWDLPDGEEEEEEDDDDDEEDEEEEENRGSEREARWCGGALWWKCILVRRKRRRCGSGVARKKRLGMCLEAMVARGTWRMWRFMALALAATFRFEEKSVGCMQRSEYLVSATTSLNYNNQLTVPK